MKKWKNRLLAGFGGLMLLIVVGSRYSKPLKERYSYSEQKKVGQYHKSDVSSAQDFSKFYKRNVPSYPPLEILLPAKDSSVDTVHVVTCGWPAFRFQNFLSILSIMKVHQPLKLVLHYWEDNTVHIQTEDDEYNLWFQQLIQEYPNIVPMQIGKKTPNCGNRKTMNQLLAQILANGGTYINGTVVLTQHLHDLRKLPMSVAYANKDQPHEYMNIAYLSVKKGQLTERNPQLEQNRVTHCASGETLKHQTKMPSSETRCVHLQFNIIPEKIMKTKDALSQLVRSTYYGSPDPIEAKWSMDDPIPNIAHMLHIGPNSMTLLTYLGIKSLIDCAAMDAVYVYVDQELKGKWAELLKKRPRVIFVQIEHIRSIYGSRLESLDNISDFLRFFVLSNYGGLYLDWDAVFYKPMGQLRGYSFVSHARWPKETTPFPNKINTGIVAAKKGSLIARKAMEEFINYNERKHLHSFIRYGTYVPYKLYEQYPDLVNIEPTFHVLCPKQECVLYNPETGVQHPLEHDDWKKVHGLHWNGKFPKSLRPYEMLLKSPSLYGEVGRYILNCTREETVRKMKEDGLSRYL